MLKRNIAILIAGGLLSAQAGLAVAAQGSFPDGAADSQYWKPWGAQEKYFAERAARDPNPTGAPRPAYATGTSITGVRLPSVNQYFAERAARDPNPTGAKGPVFPSIDGDRLVASPAVEKYFAERAAKIGAERTARGGVSVLDELVNEPHMQSKPD
jgi:hypothetical protein